MHSIFKIFVSGAIEAAIISATGCIFQEKLRRLDFLLEFLLFVAAGLVLPDVAAVPPAAGQSERIHLKFGGQVFHSYAFSFSSCLSGYLICRPIDFIWDKGKVVVWLAR